MINTASRAYRWAVGGIVTLVIVLTLWFAINLLVMSSALADSVYTCTVPTAKVLNDCSAANVQLVASPNQTDLVVVPAAGTSVTVGQTNWAYLSPPVEWHPWNTIQPGAVVGMCYTTLAAPTTDQCAAGNGGGEGWNLKSAFYVYTPPLCMPAGFGEIHFHTAAGKFYSIHYCDQPTGIQWYYRVFDSNKIVPTAINLLLSGTLNQAQLFAADKALINRSTLADEDAEYATWAATSAALHAYVAASGAATVRPIFAKNADGTQGAATGTTVKIGTECNFGDRLVRIAADGTKTGTSFFAVPGGYATCALTQLISR